MSCFELRGGEGVVMTSSFPSRDVMGGVLSTPWMQSSAERVKSFPSELLKELRLMFRGCFIEASMPLEMDSLLARWIWSDLLNEKLW